MVQHCSMILYFSGKIPFKSWKIVHIHYYYLNYQTICQLTLLLGPRNRDFLYLWRAKLNFCFITWTKLVKLLVVLLKWHSFQTNLCPKINFQTEFLIYFFLDSPDWHQDPGVWDPSSADPLHGQRDPHRWRRHLLQSVWSSTRCLQGSGF